MMHVAEAGEAKGRVVLELCSGQASPAALEAAIWVARAFQSEIEALFVENVQLIELANYPFAREISLSGRSRAISAQDIERHFRFASRSFCSQVEQRARAAEVPLLPRIVRDDPIHAIEAACSEKGPWNLVALAAPFTSGAFPSLNRLFDTVSGTTGLMVVGPFCKPTPGPIVLAVEQIEQLTALLATAERLAAVAACDIAICLVASHEADLHEIEPSARLALADQPRVSTVIAELTSGSPTALAQRLRRLKPQLILGQFGGLLVPDEAELKCLAGWIECPLILARRRTAAASDEDDVSIDDCDNDPR